MSSCSNIFVVALVVSVAVVMLWEGVKVCDCAEPFRSFSLLPNVPVKGAVVAGAAGERQKRCHHMPRAHLQGCR